ncbi:MAG: hypothetical protein ACE5LB_10280, partial [Acidiferrobacterales bacterium]
MDQTPHSAARAGTQVTQSTDVRDPLGLGISGFTYADLYDSARPKDLLATFDDRVGGSDPELLARYQ